MSDLTGKKILLSASLPPDFGSFSSESDVIDAIEKLSIGLAKLGATVVYGGNLAENGFTEIIIRALLNSDLERGRPLFIHVIDEPTLIQSGYRRISEVLKARRSGAIFTRGFIGSELGQLSVEKNEILFRTLLENRKYGPNSFPSLVEDMSHGEAFAHARRWKAHFADACIAIGGKTGILDRPDDRYFGDLPGVAEEVISFLDLNKPVVTLGAYGGCATETARALGLLESPYLEQPVRQSGFGLAMDILSNLREGIPSNVLDALIVAADMAVTPGLLDLASAIITTWSERELTRAAAISDDPGF